MKRLLAVVFSLTLGAAVVHADDKPAPSGVALALTTTVKGEPEKTQMPQYQIVTVLATQWGFHVDSRVATLWDKFLPKDKVTVPAPAKDGAPKDGEKPAEKPAPAAPPAFTIEGTIQYVEHKVPFYGGTLPTICFASKVNVVVKDASGKELKKIAWADTYGNNAEVGEDRVLKTTEERATRFLTVDILSIQEIADAVPQDKKEEFKKFVASEKEFRDKNFDDYSKHVTGGGDEKK
jgi:hypothetical protein